MLRRRRGRSRAGGAPAAGDEGIRGLDDLRVDAAADGHAADEPTARADDHLGAELFGRAPGGGDQRREGDDGLVADGGIVGVEEGVRHRDRQFTRGEWRGIGLNGTAIGLNGTAIGLNYTAIGCWLRLSA